MSVTPTLKETQAIKCDENRQFRAVTGVTLLDLASAVAPVGLSVGLTQLMFPSVRHPESR